MMVVSAPLSASALAKGGFPSFLSCGYAPHHRTGFGLLNLRCFAIVRSAYSCHALAVFAGIASRRCTLRLSGIVS